MKRREKTAVTVAIVAVAAFCLFLFINSAQDGESSAKISGVFVDIIKAVLGFFGISCDDSAISFFVRKTAHFAGYFILSAIVSYFIYRFTKRKRFMAFSVIFSFATALCDEFIIQNAAEGRSPEWRDIAIDMSGASIAVCTVALCLFIKSKKEMKK